MQTNQILKEREKYLMQVKKEKEKAVATAPEGTLRVCSNEGRTQYYHRVNPKDTSGVYIREKDVQIAAKLAQKDYDKKVLGAAQKELKAISKYFSGCSQVSPEQVYENLHEERRKLIVPIRETDEQYVRDWESVEYRGKEFPVGMPELYTAKGERVRSKSEIIIADALGRAGVPYRYEYPICLKGMGKVHPDFTVLNVKLRKEIYWEHLGMLDDPVYVENAIQKIASYEKNGYWQGEGLILTYETKDNPINQKQILRIIQHYLQ